VINPTPVRNLPTIRPTPTTQKTSHSFEGQDSIILSLLRRKTQGTYLDIGAAHPTVNSNSYRLYLIGWTGHAVDANQDYSPLWEKYRPKDMFISALISDTKRLFTFTQFDNSELSSADPETTSRYGSRPENKAIKTTSRESTTIEELVESGALSKHYDIICIDVEGLDLNVLNSCLNAKLFPLLFVVELKNYSLRAKRSNTIIDTLDNHGYSLIAKTPLDGFFIKRDEAQFNWIPSEML